MYAVRMADDERERLRAAIGLCLDCRHSRRIKSHRGSEFYLCELSATDPRFPKYPVLPVIICPGYVPKN